MGDNQKLKCVQSDITSLLMFHLGHLNSPKKFIKTKVHSFTWATEGKSRDCKKARTKSHDLSHCQILSEIVGNPCYPAAATYLA